MRYEIFGDEGGVMKFTLVTGRAVTIECRVCKRQVVGGTEAYISAASGEPVQPSEIYKEKAGGVYCSECAAKLVVEDPTKSVNQFFSDTLGNEIEPEHL
jgi:hypothetical protein